MKYTLRKYIPVDEVFNRVSSSLKSYFDSDMVLIDDYYKVIDLCNTRMGLRINPTKEIFLPIEGGRTDLPEDFYLLEIGLVVDNSIVSYNLPTIKTEHLSGECMSLTELAAWEKDKCCDFTLSCGKKPVLICKYEHQTIEFQNMYYARLSEKKYASNSCFNLNIGSNCDITMEIANNQIFFDTITEGHIYLQYTSSMRGAGNIPVCLDNEIALNYYESALKYEILCDLFTNKRLEIGQAVAMAEKKHIQAKNEALSLASTPEVSELFAITNALKRMYRRKNNILY